jgi:hypothetical protein
MSFHFWWYVERHITPHGLRVMALQFGGPSYVGLKPQKVKEVKVLAKKKLFK